MDDVTDPGDPGAEPAAAEPDSSRPPDGLVALGWDAERARQFAAVALPGARPGRVRRVDRGECDVVTGDGEVRALSDSQRAQGAVAPATGDWVAVADDHALGPVIAAILPRTTTLERRDPSEAVAGQVLLANVDVVGVVCGLDRPLRVARIERFLVVAASGGAEAVVVLSKTDLADPDVSGEVLSEQLPDVQVVRTSAVTGEGLDELRRAVTPHRTLALVGESGSGKSSLVNALVGEAVLDVGAVRRGDAKGRHTTTARELVALPGGGVLVDTPGVRGVGLWDARPAIDVVFADIADLADACRFRDCRHTVEPGCAVAAAVAEGALAARRLDRYHRLLAELDEQDAQRGPRRRR